MEQGGTVQVGTSQVGTAQVGIDQVGTAQVGTAQVGTAQVGTGQVGTAQVGTAQVRRNSIPESPLIPLRYTLLEYFEMFFICYASSSSYRNKAHYFCLHRGQFAGKHCKLASSLRPTLEIAFVFVRSDHFASGIVATESVLLFVLVPLVPLVVPIAMVIMMTVVVV